MKRITSFQTCVALTSMLVAMSAIAQPDVPSDSVAAPIAKSASSGKPTKSMRATNRLLSKSVIRTLSRTKGLDSTHIFVKAANGDVTLSGTVTDPDQIDLAVKTAQGVAGVKSVRNLIRLQVQSS
ncbi:BON domain-containing protein [Paraburkholderia megapolitana]|uniref:BON domain-containing protein n=1 Tax=Paraburkholderia megapolitana TaxID=420953 RepID=UPI0038BCE689